jgi:hypothetical protein
MLVFAKQKLVFLSVPKTGTTAYARALGAQAAIVVNAPPELKHAPVFRYNRYFRRMVERFAGPDVDIVAVMREPLDWLASWYRYRSREELRGQPPSTLDMSFDTFVRAYCQSDVPEFARVGSQAKFLEPQRNGTRVTHLFRYEDQAGLRHFLESRLGHEVITEQVNRSSPRPVEIEPGTRDLLERAFAADFTLYSGIRDGGAYSAPEQRR